MYYSGRIRHHLKQNLWRPECGIVFVGFQAAGTLGRSIIGGGRSVDILGEDIAVKAKIYTLGGFSAHADQRELLEWVSSFKNAPRVFVVHGEEKVSQVFSEIVQNRLGFTVNVQVRGEVFQLQADLSPADSLYLLFIS